MKSKLMKIFRSILVVIIIACLVILAKRFYDYRTNAKNNQYIENVLNKVDEDTDTSSKEDDNLSKEEKEWAQKEKKFMKVVAELKAQNSDVVGFLEIPALNIAYPLLKGPDNDFYLRKGLNKQYDIAGSIFIDANNSGDLNDDNTVIYGHHLEIDSMFTRLHDFRDQDFVSKNREIYITAADGLHEYKIFSVFGTPSGYDYRTLNFKYPEEKINYYNKLKANSEVSLQTDDFKENDKIITLSTCEYDYDDQRLAVQAVRVR
ncbi:MAG: class B sortase [Peptoniphilaceae bacterium]|nr:class B sortase [Peptoniphilaceae bacterium]MDY6019444.1 class B sortase [Anaerococcus sp.]